MARRKLPEHVTLNGKKYVASSCGTKKRKAKKHHPKKRGPARYKTGPKKGQFKPRKG